jgi:hypothetical protein
MADPNKPTSSFGFRPEYSVLNITSLSSWHGENLANGSPILYDSATGGFKAGPPGSQNGGDVLGPSSATDTTVPVFDTTSGKVLKGTGVKISDNNEMSELTSLSLNGSLEGTLTIKTQSYTETHEISLPGVQGLPGTVLTNDGAGNLMWNFTNGDVFGPSGGSTDNAIARFNGTNGSALKNTGVIIEDNNAVSGVLSLGLTGSLSGELTLQSTAEVDDYSLTLPGSQGANGTALVNNGTGLLSWTRMGDVIGPAGGSTDKAIPRFNGASGQMLQDTDVTINDTGDIAGVASLTMDGATSGRVTLQPAATTSNHSLTLPSSQGEANTFLKNNGSGLLAWAVPADVFGPAGATDNALARFSLESGKLIKSSVAALSDAGDLTGVTNITVAGKVTGLVAPTDASDAANKGYVDSAVSGLKYKSPVVAASTANVPLRSGLLTIDGVPLSATDRVLLKDQNTGAENGIYVAAAGAWPRAADLAAGASAKSVALTVISGTANGKKSFVCTNAAGSDVVGTDALSFVLFQANADGDVVGPGTAVDNSVVRFDTTSGKLIQSSGVTISDTADIAGAKTIALSGSGSGALTVQAAAATSSHTLTMPAAQGAANSFLRNSGTGALTWAAVGDVTGPGGSTTNAIARYQSGTGKVIKNSDVTISDNAGVAGVKTLAMDGATSGALTLAPAASTASYALTFPPGQGTENSYLKNDGNGGLSWNEVSRESLGAGDVEGPPGSAVNSIALFDSETGKTIKSSYVTIEDDFFSTLNMNNGIIDNLRALNLGGGVINTVTLRSSIYTVQDYQLTLPTSPGSAGEFLQNTGYGNLTWASPTSFKDMKIYPLAGTYTYTPAGNVTRAIVYVTGGGAAGAGTNSITGSHGAGSGGGAGATSVGLFIIDADGSGVITVGAGGTASAGGAGNDGEDSVFSFTKVETASLTATGGKAAFASSIKSPFLRLEQGGAGGTALLPVQGDGTRIQAFLPVTGGQGGGGMAIGYQVVSSGAGGSSYWGAGGTGSTINNIAQNKHGQSAIAYGSGGSGAVMTNSGTMNGGNGKNGVVVIFEY